MIHHYQEEFNNFIERVAEFFGLANVGIYGQFVVMLGTLSIVGAGESSNLFVSPDLDAYPWLHTLHFIIGEAAKFFTACVGAIATIKFVSQVYQNISNYFKKKKDGQDNIRKD